MSGVIWFFLVTTLIVMSYVLGRLENSKYGKDWDR